MNNDLDIFHTIIDSNIELILMIVGSILLPSILYAITKIGNMAYREFVEFKNSQPEIIQYFLWEAAKIAYKFVEQKTKGLDGIENSQKLEMAVIKANEWLKNLNYDLPKDAIITAIETYIYNIKDELNDLDFVKDIKKDK